MNIRNVAIIAHVDHGKTTLVDALLRQSKTQLGKTFDDTSSLIMDSNELERERGITIFSKNASVQWQDTKINIIDTPGHADFGGEVERVLKMADGCLLLVDAKEGPMPQTRFVLKQALKMKHKIIVVINKIDRTDARPSVVLNKTFDLFVDLGADDETADFPVIYASAKHGKAGSTANLAEMTDISPIFEAILQYIPSPSGNPEKPLQMMVTSIAADNFKGRLGIGRIYNGILKHGQTVAHMKRDGTIAQAKVSSLMSFEGLTKKEVIQASVGDIVALAGIETITIGETVADPELPIALPVLEIEEPTVTMTFSVNDSLFKGLEGRFVTSRQLRQRLYKELETDIALRVTDNDPTSFTVSGRGELHLAILIERMRREGYELQVSRPKVITKTIDGKTYVPFDRVAIEVPDEYAGVVMRKMGARYGQLQHMSSDQGLTSLEFVIPTRGLFGYRSEFMIDTRGVGIINATFEDYQPDPGSWHEREQGSLVAFESGTTNLYGLLHVQDRGVLFLGPAIKVYQGQVVGRNARPGDLRVNVCKEKHLTNMRSKGEGGAEHFNTPKVMDLEDALEYIADDELVEVTPQSVRIRKVNLSG